MEISPELTSHGNQRSFSWTFPICSLTRTDQVLQPGPWYRPQQRPISQLNTQVLLLVDLPEIFTGTLGTCILVENIWWFAPHTTQHLPRRNDTLFRSVHYVFSHRSSVSMQCTIGIVSLLPPPSHTSVWFFAKNSSTCISARVWTLDVRLDSGLAENASTNLYHVAF